MGDPVSTSFIVKDETAAGIASVRRSHEAASTAIDQSWSTTAGKVSASATKIGQSFGATAADAKTMATKLAATAPAVASIGTAANATSTALAKAGPAAKGASMGFAALAASGGATTGGLKAMIGAISTAFGPLGMLTGAVAIGAVGLAEYASNADAAGEAVIRMAKNQARAVATSIRDAQASEQEQRFAANQIARDQETEHAIEMAELEGRRGDAYELQLDAYEARIDAARRERDAIKFSNSASQQQLDTAEHILRAEERKLEIFGAQQDKLAAEEFGGGGRRGRGAGAASAPKAALSIVPDLPVDFSAQVEAQRTAIEGERKRHLELVTFKADTNATLIEQTTGDESKIHAIRMQQIRDEAEAKISLIGVSGMETKQAEHEANLIHMQAEADMRTLSAENDARIFDEEMNRTSLRMELAEINGQSTFALEQQQLDMMQRRAVAMNDQDALAQVLHLREVARRKNIKKVIQDVTQSTSQFAQAGADITSTIIAHEIKDEKKREKALLRTQGVKAMAIGAIEMVQAIADFASFNFVGGALHTAAAAVAFVQGGYMLAGKVPQQGSASGGAGGGAEGGGVTQDRKTSEAAKTPGSGQAAEKGSGTEGRGTGGRGGNNTTIHGNVTYNIMGTADENAAATIGNLANKGGYTREGGKVAA